MIIPMSREVTRFANVTQLDELTLKPLTTKFTPKPLA